jgi:hypothetical protein
MGCVLKRGARACLWFVTLSVTITRKMSMGTSRMDVQREGAAGAAADAARRERGAAPWIMMVLIMGNQYMTELI